MVCEAILLTGGMLWWAIEFHRAAKVRFMRTEGFWRINNNTTNRLGRKIWQIHFRWKIKRGYWESSFALREGGSSVPRWSCPPFVEEGQLRPACWCWRSGFATSAALSLCSKQLIFSSPQSIWLLFLSTSLLKFLSLPVMQLVITRNNVLSLVIFNWQLETTKSRDFLLSSFIRFLFTEFGCRLCRLLGDVVISQGGVVPHIAPVRLLYYLILVLFVVFRNFSLVNQGMPSFLSSW